MTVAEFQEQVETAQVLLEIEFEGCLEVGVDPIAFAQAAAQTAAVAFGHYHRAMSTCDEHFRDFVIEFASRLLAEATRHRFECPEDGGPNVRTLESRLLH